MLLRAWQLRQDLLQSPCDAIHRLVHGSDFLFTFLRPCVIRDYLQCIPDMVIHLCDDAQAILHNPRSMLLVRTQDKNEQCCYQSDKKI